MSTLQKAKTYVTNEDSMPSKAVLLVGGLGTRLRPVTNSIPKALLDVNGKTVTEHLMDLLRKYKVNDLILSVGYLKEKIKEHFGDGSAHGLNVAYVEEEEPLGTAGPLLLAKHALNGSFICSNGDELKEINIKEMYRLHKSNNALATIALTEVEDPSLYGVAKLEGSKIIEFVEKPKLEEAPSKLINAGFYILEPEVIDLIKPGFCMLEKDVFPILAKEGKLFGYHFKGQWFDIGNFERWELAKKNWTGISFK